MDLSRFDPADVVRALAPLIDPARRQRLDEVAASRLAGVAAVLEDLRDPHNAGAALRSAEAFGVLRVHVVSVQNRFRTSAGITQGCEKWLELEHHRSTAAGVARVHAEGYRLYAMVPGAGRLLDDLDPRAPIALAFGNEHLGLSPELCDLADGHVAIPMVGCSQSLNVSVSAAVALYAATQARRRALARAGDLDPPTLLALRARYYARDLRGAVAIVERALAAG